MKKVFEIVIWSIVAITSLMLILKRTNPAALDAFLHSLLFVEFIITNLPTTVVCCAGMFLAWKHFPEKPFVYKYTITSLAIFLGELWLIPLATWQIYIYLQPHLSTTNLYYVSMGMGLLTNSIQALAITLMLYGILVEKSRSRPLKTD